MRFSVLLFLVSCLCACRPVDILDALTPGTGYRLSPDISYGDSPRLQLDVYRPTSPRAVPAPVIVFFYGGSWNSGDKGDYRFVGQRLASLGFVVVVPDYRLYPAVKFPTFLEDGAAALRWTQERIAAYGGDPRRLFLMGHSAGAYNAMMLGLDRRYAAAAGFDFSRLCGIVGLAGPYDFEFDSDLLRGIFGSALDPRAALPVTYAASPAPPVLLIVGDADDTVLPANSESLARALTAANNPVRLLHYPGLNHIDVVLQLSSFWKPTSKVQDEIIGFLTQPTGDGEGRTHCPSRPGQ